MLDSLRRTIEDKLKLNKKVSKASNDSYNNAKIVAGSSLASFQVKEAYKAARTNIMFALGDTGECKKVVFTSASPGEGKTTTCINMAVTFSQRPGTRVLLIDGDLRRPRIHRTLGLKNDVGFSNLLASFCEATTFKPQKTEYGFDCVTAGTIPPNPSELLASPKAAEVINTFAKHYDFIFIDTPPVTVVTDAVIANNFSDGTVMVVRQSYTKHDIINKAVNALKYADAKILGFVLNYVKTENYKYKNKYNNLYYKEQDEANSADSDLLNSKK